MRSLPKWKTCTFLPRAMPTAILVEDGTVIGPFCQHCGAPRDRHDSGGHCSAFTNPLWPLPCCGCHAATEDVASPGAKVTAWNSRGAHRVVLDETGTRGHDRP